VNPLQIAVVCLEERIHPEQAAHLVLAALGLAVRHTLVDQLLLVVHFVPGVRVGSLVEWLLARWYRHLRQLSDQYWNHQFRRGTSS
jgi:hypothetical protein